ncbi:Glycosyltransferase involved in cell wall bisynthesis [Microvirga guangxiensis]|uniref:Glycosyltransferase involved in cell wall bisynthesis n=2 Tax=Microvirga guangxiensis TaxID=549386 RepID=A0A1G5H1B8_9HYPH|nr:Glycosyltransferase involved in cell wall bisynthesis [Microvirga guangxiensis]
MVATLAMASNSSRVEAFVCPWRGGGSYAKDLRNAGVSVLEWPGAEGAPRAYATMKLRRFAQQQQIDLVHAHMSDSAVLAAAALSGTGIPFIVTHHSNRLLPKERPVKSALRSALTKWATGRASRNIGVTNAVSERLSLELRVSGERLETISNGIAIPDDSRIIASGYHRQNRFTAQGGPRIVALGRLVGLKRHVMMIEALSRVRDTLPDAHLAIAGDGPERETLAACIDRLNLGSHVTLLGSINDVGEFLSQADIFVSMSSYEGLPVSVLEAMSWGLPVIISDVPGHRDVVQDNIDGCLVPFDDVDALTGQIIHLARHPSEAARMGSAARNKVIRDYSSVAMADNYLRLYTEILAKP